MTYRCRDMALFHFSLFLSDTHQGRVWNQTAQPELVTIAAAAFPTVTVVVIAFQDSTSSRLLPGSSYSCCIRNLHALVHK
jgi:hypothetical protein